jgi:hypothetical protein
MVDDYIKKGYVKVPLKKLICQKCGKEFERKVDTIKYCSRACRYNRQKKRIGNEDFETKERKREYQKQYFQKNKEKIYERRKELNLERKSMF